MRHPATYSVSANAINLFIVLCTVLIFSCHSAADAGSKEQESFASIKDTLIHGITFVKVPAGAYKKGIDCITDSVKYDYWIGKYEISNAQFTRFLTDALKKKFLFSAEQVAYYHYMANPPVPEGDYRVRISDERIRIDKDSIRTDTTQLDHPATSVSWFGARAFCDFYGFDLPTEAEWEKAARGNTSRWFPWGNTIDSSYANYFNSNDPFEPGTTPVGYYNGTVHGTFKTHDARSYYGCYDMAGNAWEWTADYWLPQIPYNKGKGGGHLYHSPAFLQIYYTSTFGPATAPALDMCNKSDGFRVVFHQKK